MEVLLLGSGAVGIGIAASIYDAGYNVDFVAKGKTNEKIKAGGIKRKGIFKGVYIPPEKIITYESISDIANKKYDYVLICTKSISNADTAKELEKCNYVMKDNGSIVIFQNGWGNDEEFMKYFDKSQIYSARVITGFTRPEENISEVTVHAEPILIGSLYGEELDKADPLVKAIRDGGIPCEITREIEKALWAKMLYNCTLNPLGAVLGVEYGRLTESENSIHIMNGIIDEIFSLMKAAGYQTYWKGPEEYKKVFYGQLIPNTYRHRSSTLQDIEKKVKTEIDSLSGCLVRLGKKHNISVPNNTMIYNMIKALESYF